MSLLKAIGTSLGMFVLYTIGGVFLSLFPIFAAVLPLRLVGFDEGSTVVLVVAAIAFVLTMCVCWGLALEYALEAIRNRPRGLGLRRVRKWKDGVPTEEWERY